MSQKKTEKEGTLEVGEKEVILPPAPTPAVAYVEPAPEIKKISFKQFVAGKPSIKPQHLSGLKAFIKNVDKLRTPEQWEEEIKGY